MLEGERGGWKSGEGERRKVERRRKGGRSIVVVVPLVVKHSSLLIFIRCTLIEGPTHHMFKLMS